MNKTLIFARKALIKTWEQMINQTNKHKKKINYEIESKMFLNKQNIITKSVVEFELLNLTQVEFQNWVELRKINSTQLNQLDELTCWDRTNDHST